MDFSNAMMDSLNDGETAEFVHSDAAGRAGPMLSPRFIAISRSLQRIFGKVVEQPLPERLQDLIHQVERAGQKRP